jgi:hypothetical protein
VLTRAEAKLETFAPTRKFLRAARHLKSLAVPRDGWRHPLQEVRFRAAGLGVGLTMNERRLLGLKNRYAGRRAFVIGNGPSLRQTDVANLTGEITIGSNGIFLLTEEKGFRPTFYTVEDRLVAEDRAAPICQYTGTTKIIPLDLSGWLRRDEDTIYVNFLRHYPGFPRFSPAFERYVCWGGTVTFLNLLTIWAFSRCI